MTDPSTAVPLDLDGIKTREAAATKGPWHAPGLGEVHSDHDNGIYVRITRDRATGESEDDCIVCDYCGDADADFIAHARQDIPALIAEVERLEAEVARLSAVRREQEMQDEDPRVERERLRERAGSTAKISNGDT